MIKTIDNCVDCPSIGLPCQGSHCSYASKEVEFCDICTEREAYYTLDGDAVCRYCAEHILKAIWEDLDLEEKINALSKYADVKTLF